VAIASPPGGCALETACRLAAPAAAFFPATVGYDASIADDDRQVLSYATPAARRPIAARAWGVFALTILQALWLAPTAYIAMGVACTTQGANIPMLLVSLFAALPAIGAVLVAITFLRSARLHSRRGVVMVTICAVACAAWILYCAGATVYGIATKSPNDIYCP
jgi:hypothetical protein